MKLLTISRNKLEIARTHLRKPRLLIGRSPTCDVILRAPGVQPIHFMVEWIGAGVFDPSKGSWSIVDISAGTDFGEGVIASEDPIAFADFIFECVEDNLEVEESIGGRILENLANQKHEKFELLEFVRARSDSGAIEEVSHFHVAKKAKKISISKDVPSFKVEWPKSKSAALLNILLEEMPEAEVHLCGKKIDPKSTFQMNSTDFLWVRWKGRDFYLRFVEEIEAPPIPQDFWGDPLLKKLTLGVSAAALVFLLLLKLWPAPAEPEKELPRIAQIEVQEVAPPPPPPPPVEEVQKEPTVANKPAELPLKEKSKESSAQAVAPQYSNQSQSNKKAKAGVNSPGKVSDVNQIGLLGALNKSMAKGKGVSVKEIVNDGVVTQSVSGKNDNSTIVVRNPPSGVLGTGGGGSPKGQANSQGLAAASTTLSGVSKYDPKSLGPIARKGGGSDYQLGTASGGGGTGLGGGGGDIGSLDGGDFSVEGGGLNRETVRRIIMSHRGQIRTCYERALLSNSKLEGRIVYQWKILAEGSVAGVEVVKNNVDSANLKTCVFEVIQKMVFPKAPNGKMTKVIYPFVFQGKH